MDFQATRSPLKRVDAIRTQMNPGLMLAGFVHTVFDARTSVAVATETLPKNTYPGSAYHKNPIGCRRCDRTRSAPVTRRLRPIVSSYDCLPDGSHQDRASRYE